MILRHGEEVLPLLLRQAVDKIQREAINALWADHEIR